MSGNPWDQPEPTQGSNPWDVPGSVETPDPDGVDVPEGYRIEKTDRGHFLVNPQGQWEPITVDGNTDDILAKSVRNNPDNLERAKKDAGLARRMLNGDASKSMGFSAQALKSFPFIGSYIDEGYEAIGFENADEIMRHNSEAFKLAYPKTSMANSLTGTVVTLPYALLKAPQALQWLAKGGLAARTGKGALAGAGFGATEGAIYGAGQGEETDKTRFENATSGAKMGAIFGGGLGTLTPSIVAGGRAAYQGVRNIAGGKNQTDAASDVILDSLKSGGDTRTLQEISSQAQKNPAAGILGADTPVPTMAPTVASKTSLDGQSAHMMQDALDVYKEGAPTRLKDSVRGSLNVDPNLNRTDVASSIAQRTNDDFVTASRNFDDVILDDTSRPLLSAAEDLGLANNVRRVTKSRASETGTPQPSQFYEEIPMSNNPKSVFGDETSVTPASTVSGVLTDAARMKAKDDLAPTVAGRLRELEPELEGLVPGLSDARQAYALGQRNAGALDSGKSAVKPATDPEIVENAYNGLTPAGQPNLSDEGRDLFRLSAAQELEKMSSATNPGSKLDGQLRDTNLPNQLRAMGVTDDSIQSLRQTAQAEGRGLSNLQTATPPRVNSGVDDRDVADATRHFAYMQPAGAIIAALSKMMVKTSDRTINGLTAKGRQEIARLTTSNNIEDVIDVLENRLSAKDRMKVMDAMTAAGITLGGTNVGQSQVR